MNAFIFSAQKCRWLLALSVFFAMAVSGFADEPTAQMSLSRKHLEVGQPVRLKIVVSGEGNIVLPREITVDGLDIADQGRSSQSSFTLNNGNMSRSQTTTETYALTPQREGKITIPAQTIEVDGKSLTTNSLTFDVAAAGKGATASGANNGAKSRATSRIAFAEIVVPKEHLYVGETMPVVLNFFFDANAQVMQVAAQGLTLKADGFTLKPFEKPQQQSISKNGKDYIELTFKTAVTPVKTGELALGGAELPFTAMAQQSAPTDDDDDSNFGGFGGNMLRQMMQNSMAFGMPQQLTVKSGAVKLDVLPLPEAGKPADFHGAVGQFKMSEESASPASVKIGDPVNLKMTISGYGNFDRVGTPEMIAVSGSSGSSGWKSYPSNGKFTPDDDLGISGSKRFEISVVPLEKQTRVPEFSFSYFDPTAKKYATLRSSEFPLVVSGSAVAPTPAIVANSAPTPSAPKRDELLPIKTDEAKWNASFATLAERPIFWTAQAAPLLALLMFGSLRYRRLRAADVNVQRRAQARREHDSLMASLQAAQTAGAFYSAAAKLLQSDAAAILKTSPFAVSEAETISARKISEEIAASIRQIFHRNEELSYAGGAAREQRVDLAERNEVLKTAKIYSEAKANA